MTKFQLMLTSLVAVIPGAFLCIVLAMAVMSYTMPAMAYAMVGITLAVAAVTVLMPLGIVVSGGRSAPAAPKPAAKKSAKDEVAGVAALDEEVEIDDMSAESVEASVVDDDDVEFNESEFALGSEDDEEGHLQTEAEVETEPLDDFENFEMESEAEDVEEFNLDFDDDEEEEKPKKKKKR